VKTPDMAHACEGGLRGGGAGGTLLRGDQGSHLGSRRRLPCARRAPDRAGNRRGVTVTNGGHLPVSTRIREFAGVTRERHRYVVAAQGARKGPVCGNCRQGVSRRLCSTDRRCLLGVGRCCHSPPLVSRRWPEAW